MNRVAITGMGIVSPLGNTLAAVADTLRQGRSCTTLSYDFLEHGFRSQVWARPEFDLDVIPRQARRFMGPGAGYAYVAMEQAIVDAGLTTDLVSHPLTGLIAGSGGPSMEVVRTTHESVVEKQSTKRVGGFVAAKTMSSSVSANLAVAFAIKGVSKSVTSACATSAHCIGDAAREIAWGTHRIMFAGGSDENAWESACIFDGMQAMSSKYNDSPDTASRPFCVNRDGFVIGSGAGILVLEEMGFAQARGAHIYGEVIGYGATSDGVHMTDPTGEGAFRAMSQAVAGTGFGVNKGIELSSIDYINAHGTSTPAGDVTEIEAIRQLMDGRDVPISSTKSMSGHALGAAGVHEAIYTLLMMQYGFIAPSINIEKLDPELLRDDIVRELRETPLRRVLSNSFGFGGTNVSLAFQSV